MPARAALLLAVLLAVGSTSLAAQATLVILARHAEKAAPSGDPPLTPAGAARAEALAAAVRGVRLGAVIVTRFQRTRLTAAPAAQAQGLPFVVIDVGRDIAAHAAAVALAVNQLPAGSAALVVGHSNTVGPILAALGGPVLPDLCDDEHATLFVLERSGPEPHFLRSRYGAPDPPGADSCSPAP